MFNSMDYLTMQVISVLLRSEFETSMVLMVSVPVSVSVL